MLKSFLSSFGSNQVRGHRFGGLLMQARKTEVGSPSPDGTTNMNEIVAVAIIGGSSITPLFRSLPTLYGGGGGVRGGGRATTYFSWKLYKEAQRAAAGGP